MECEINEWMNESIGWTPVYGFFVMVSKFKLQLKLNHSSVNVAWVDVRQFSVAVQINSYAQLTGSCNCNFN